MRGGVKMVVAVLLLIVIAGPLAYVELMLHWSYSTGERAGWLQKLSHRGVLCKTWEGELSMISVPGSAPEKFYFSVRDEAVAKQVNAMMGRRVSLTYEQKVGLPTSCFGDTQYFVSQVNTVEDSAFGAPSSVPAPAPSAPASPPSASP